jgi:hypothetical protein
MRAIATSSAFSRAAALGGDVVRLFDLQRVDLLQLDELLDPDGAVALGLRCAELLRGEAHHLRLRERVPLDDVLPGDLLAVPLADPLLADPASVGVVVQVELEVPPMGRRIERDRDVHQSKADASFPVGAGHVVP